jgi:hypothetical protein
MKKYEEPKVEIIELGSSDVIMTSMPGEDDLTLPDGSIELSGISLK